MAEPRSEDQTEIPDVAWADVVSFIRQLSHDLRNHLNAIELQSAYISELEKDEELKNEIKRLREMVSGMTSTLQLLSKAVSDVKPTPIPYPATDFMEDLRAKIDSDFSGKNAEIRWEIQLGNAVLNIDPQLLQEAFTELFANASRQDQRTSAVIATAKVEENGFVFTLKEQRARFDLPTKNWGREPLRKMSQGHYGLGLNRVRAIIEAHGGEMRAQYDSKNSVLVTRLTLPASAGSPGDS
jgi:light-regulated signal transduction histidine kinase (bacteriophytochrome)